MHRCLKPGGMAIMSFSNRCFPTKGAWRAVVWVCVCVDGWVGGRGGWGWGKLARPAAQGRARRPPLGCPQRQAGQLARLARPLHDCTQRAARAWTRAVGRLAAWRVRHVMRRPCWPLQRTPQPLLCGRPPVTWTTSGLLVRLPAGTGRPHPPHAARPSLMRLQRPKARPARRCLPAPAYAWMADRGRPSACPTPAGSYFHYSVPGGFAPPQAKDISPKRGLLGGGGDPM